MVVPMLRESGLSFAYSFIRLSALTITPFINFSIAALDITTSSVIFSGLKHSRTVDIAISEATSPAFIPPIPSATTKRAPFLPRVYSWLLTHFMGSSSRFAETWKSSSLLVLSKPTSVLAAILKRISLIFVISLISYLFSYP